VLRIDEDPKINWLKAVTEPNSDNVFPDFRALIKPFKPAPRLKAAAEDALP